MKLAYAKLFSEGIVIKVKKRWGCREGKDREGRKEKGKIKTWSVPSQN